MVVVAAEVRVEVSGSVKEGALVVYGQPLAVPTPHWSLLKEY